MHLHRHHRPSREGRQRRQPFNNSATSLVSASHHPAQDTMTATTASPSRPSGFFSHRYSDSMVSSPHSRESSYTHAYPASSLISHTSDTASHPMSFSILSPSAGRGKELVRASTPRRSSQGDMPADSAATGVKYACASCIRGHRTSSCTHQDGSKGPLQPIRSKGRPPTQCEICRKKRKESGRHVRCDCTGKKSTSAATTSTPSHPPKKPAVTRNPPILPRIVDETSAPEGSQRPAKRTKTQVEHVPERATSTLAERRFSDASSSDESLSQTSAHDSVLAPIRLPRTQHSWSLPSIHSAHDVPPAFNGTSQPTDELTPRRSSTLSLSSLMNPCGCRSTGSCSTCSEQRRRRAPVSPKQLNSAPVDCDSNHCSPSHTRTAETDQSNALTHAQSSEAAAASCCSGKNVSASAVPSIELLLRAVDMTTEFVPPPCGCGPGCRCSRCLAKSTPNTGLTDLHRSTPHHASSTVSASSASPRTPPSTLAARSAPGCDDCAACDLALERPSGIGAVDSWMEKQREHSPARRRSPSTDSVSPTRASKQQSDQWGSEPIVASVPTMHGGLLTSEGEEGEEVHAELVLVHPGCAACLEVVRSKGVGVLCSAK